MPQLTENDKKLEALLNKFYNEIKEDKEPRSAAKEAIKPALDFLVENAIGEDPKFTKSLGIVSRSYRGTGTYGASDFDVHLPLVPPEEAKIEVVKAPQVLVTLMKSSGDWRNAMEGNVVSANKLRIEVYQKFLKAAQQWNAEKAEEAEIEVLDLVKNRAPISVKLTPVGKTPLILDCTPVLSTEALPGLEEIKEKMATKSPASGFFPPDDEVRSQIANQILLIPSGDTSKWVMSLMMGQKMMVKSLDDGGETCRLQLYRTFKMINKYFWNVSPNDHEMVKLGMHCVQNVFFTELSKHPEPEKWAPENLVPRFKYMMLEIRHKFAQGEVTEYMLPGSPNLMVEYKQTNGFLVPKLGGMVRRMEVTMKDPVKVLSTLMDKWKDAGKMTH